LRRGGFSSSQTHKKNEREREREREEKEEEGSKEKRRIRRKEEAQYFPIVNTLHFLHLKQISRG